MSTTTSTGRAVAEAIGAVLDSTDREIAQVMILSDPWSPDFSSSAWKAINEKCSEIWPHLRTLMPGQTDVYCLQQAVAARYENRMHVGFLYRAALEVPQTVAEAHRLRDIVMERWKKPGEGIDARYRAMVEFLMASDEEAASVPNLGRHTPYRGSIRLRYRIANATLSGAGLGVVLDAVAGQPAATSYQRKVELVRAVKAAHACGRNWRLLGELEFTLLSQPARALLLNTTEIWPLVFAQSMLAGGQLLERAGALMAEHDRIASALSRLVNEIRARRFAAAESTLDQIPDTPLGRALCNRLRSQSWELQALRSQEELREGVGAWCPMSPQALSRIQSWAREPLPVWWSMEGPAVAALITTGSLDDGDQPKKVPIPPKDLALLRQTWSEEDQKNLIRAGYGHLLPSAAPVWTTMKLPELAPALLAMPHVGAPQLAKRLDALPDAQPWLELMANAANLETAIAYREVAQMALELYWRDRWDNTWSRWILPSYGCDAWEKIESIAIARTSPLRDAVALFSAGSKPLYPGGFQAVVARSLHKEEMLPQKPLNHLRAWLVRDPLAARALVEHAPEHWLERLARNVGTPVQTLDIFMGAKSLPESIRRLAWRNRLARTTDARELAQLAVRMPVGLGAFQNLSQWVVTGPSSIQAMGLVLTARRDGARLQQLNNQLGPAVFSQACADAVRYLREQAIKDTDTKTAARAEREAATLELLMHLGGDAARSLLKVLANRDITAAPGCKLDHAYSEYSIAKRRGGERIIRAPEPALKEIQRALLDKLLEPLGAHDAACGFVRGKSIAHNAQPHVGKAVVINADIKNCFPSVKWPLVLGVVRRELGTVLAPAAISVVVDLVTAHGALPVGAPTSPAILNLALRKTDELLSRQALRLGGDYTRYADDLTFSGNDTVVGLIRHAQRLIGQLGLELDPSKTNIFRRGRRQMVTGLTVNDHVSVPRAIRRQLRAAVHQVEQGNTPQWEGLPQDLAALRGRLGFVSMVRPEHGAALVLRLDCALAAREVIRSASAKVGSPGGVSLGSDDKPNSAKGGHHE